MLLKRLEYVQAMAVLGNSHENGGDNGDDDEMVGKREGA